jgi:predicted membrane channel-forming protein YqfA (hemolysin III family)
MLLWVTLGIGVLRGVIRYIRHADVRSLGLGELITLGLWVLSVFLIVQVWKGRHWARITWIVFFCLAVPIGILPLFESVTYFPVAKGLGIVQSLVWLVAIVLMFQRDASKWFRSQHSDSSSVS